MSLTKNYHLVLLKTAFVAAAFGCFFNTIAKEGMWLPANLKKNEADMKSQGLEIPVDKIYNANGTGLNNSIVLFGSGCTAEVISPKGLLLTNHHCGYGTVQGLSSKDHDYFANGFFAKNNKDEIPCPGLAVTFVRRMENVSNVILQNIPDTLDNPKRDSIISVRIKNLEKGWRFTTKMDATIKPLFNGNQYWVFLTETFKDIRLVGFPPNGIGSFGGDSDNWMWPRHTGDFSMFRIYAGKDNKPADFSADNKPYQAKNFLTINIAGYKEGDFSMVYGFPANTQEYISSYQLNQILKTTDPIRISIRTKKLECLSKNMSASRDIFLKYTSKRAGIANGWKKWQGEVKGLEQSNAIEMKKTEEADYQAWATANVDKLGYAHELLGKIQVNAVKVDSALKADTYISEAVFGIETIQQSATLDKILNLLRSSSMGDAAKNDSITKLAKATDAFFKNYDAATDKDMFQSLMPMYYKGIKSWTPIELRKSLKYYKGKWSAMASDVYNLSFMANQEKFNNFIAKIAVKDTLKIMSDPGWRLYNAVAQFRKLNITPLITQYNNNLAFYNRLYMNAQMTQYWNTNFYPDANQTLRLTYGKIEGLDPCGPANYSYQTTLDEAIAKDDRKVDEFKVPSKLKELYTKKDYGRWKVNNTVPIAFTATNHTSGGNSGSPVLNAKGQLIGTNFDRAWEGTMSDLHYDPKLCRNIALDIRYTLFIVEKFGDAGWLLKEMKMVKK